MIRERMLILLLPALFIVVGNVARGAEPAAKPASSVTIRCAVIGGLTEADFFTVIAGRFEKQTGHHVEIVARGPKTIVAQAMTEGDADLATMHVSDTIINLVADGYAADPQPWARNDLVIAGPVSDPAGIRGEKDAVEAVRKIIESRSKILIHASAGASEVLHELLAAGELELDPQRTISLPSDRHRQMLMRAVEEEAYTIVGRIPFLNAKIPRGGAEIMVQGDPRLRRPYVVVVANRKAKDAPSLAAAREMALFLRDKETQQFIAEFGRGHLDERPLFFPIETEPRR